MYRLGDIVNHDIPQIWEQLESFGLTVGAISPMNAKYRMSRPAFFVPDPWTQTEVVAPPPLKRLYRAIVQAVNDNAQARITPGSALALLVGLLTYGRRANYHRYLQWAATSVSRPWRRSMVLDLLLADVFIDRVKHTRPDFASLFLNAGAHIQHHYMFNAAPYRGPSRNPAWYVRPDADPVLDVYRAYDTILTQIQREFPQARIMIATGLHQTPHGEVTYYWRLRDHAEFLKKIGVRFRRALPRMSRDFVVEFDTAEDAAAGELRLRNARALNGVPLFEVDNRGTSLFVMLTFPQEIGDDFCFRIGSETFTDLRKDVVFVALKNGKHDGIGYFIDLDVPRGGLPEEFPLAALPQRVMSAFGLRASDEAPRRQVVFT